MDSPPPKAGTVLDRILEKRSARLEEARRRRPLAELKAACADAPPVRDFARALAVPSGAAGAARARIIAEIKRRSPSRGALRADLDPAAISRAYEAGGAVAISVLTEQDHFDGSLDDLRAARGAVSLPVLRKDFLTDAYQLYEAREAGADAVLLIVAALGAAELSDLVARAREIGLATLVEAHDEAEVRQAVAAGAEIVGINNRDLRTLEVSLETSVRLAPLVPAGRTVVAESGIHGPAELGRLASAGIHAFLVGEHLMLSPNPALALDLLIRGVGP